MIAELGVRGADHGLEIDVVVERDDGLDAFGRGAGDRRADDRRLPHA